MSDAVTCAMCLAQAPPEVAAAAEPGRTPEGWYIDPGAPRENRCPTCIERLEELARQDWQGTLGIFAGEPRGIGTDTGEGSQRLKRIEDKLDQVLELLKSK